MSVLGLLKQQTESGGSIDLQLEVINSLFDELNPQAVQRTAKPIEQAFDDCLPPLITEPELAGP